MMEVTPAIQNPAYRPAGPYLVQNRAGGLQMVVFCAPVLTYLSTLRSGARKPPFSPRHPDFGSRYSG
jgi:hypothetical protein